MAHLHWAARRGLVEEVAVSIAAGHLLNDQDRLGATPLLLASAEGYLKVVLQLLDAGADSNIPLNNGMSPLDKAARKGHLPLVKVLVQRGAEVNRKGFRGITPTLWAAMFNQVQTVEFLIEQGADPKATEQGRTALEWLEVGGVHGLMRERMPHRTDPVKQSQQVRGMMAKSESVEQYAAKRGRNTYIFSYHLTNLPDFEADAWAKRFAEILASPQLLAECEDRFLTGEELAQAVRHRDRAAHAEARRVARDAKPAAKRAEIG